MERAAGFRCRTISLPSRKLYTGLTIPDDFKKPSQSEHAGPANIEKEFAIGQQGPRGSVSRFVSAERVFAVEVCLTRTYSTRPAQPR